MSHTLVLTTSPAHAFDVLGPLERKGFTLVGLKTVAGEAILAIRGHPGLCERGAELCEWLRPVLPVGAAVRAAASLAESLELLHATFGPRELVQWAPDEQEEEPCEWLRAAAPAMLGDHNGHREAYVLAELLRPGAVGSELGRRFCAQLRRDGYAPLLLGAEQQRLYNTIEEEASAWFAQEEEAKLEQAGVYAHINRKFTGYRCGKFREQLELRQTRHGSLYPQVGQGPCARAGPDGLSPAVSLYMRWVDAWARALLRHIAADLGASADFFAALVDPPTAPADAPAAAATVLTPPLASQLAAERARLGKLPVHLPPPPEYEDDDDDAGAGAQRNGHHSPPPPPPPPQEPPELGHSLLRACRYDSESEGVYGSGVLCEAHNDVGFLTFDACAATPGLHALRRADGLWVAVEEAPKQTRREPMVMMCMVGDTLGYLTRQHYAPCKHRVMAPPRGRGGTPAERIGLPFLFRGRSDAVLNTTAEHAACKAAGRACHLAEMETTTIKELPAFDSAKSILRNWFASVK